MAWKYNPDAIDAITPQSGLDLATSRAGRRPSPRAIAHTGGVPATTSTPGTAVTPVTTTTYLAELFVPATVDVNGIAVFNGTDVTGNVKAGIYDATGKLIAETASTAGSGTSQYQRIPLTKPIKLVGPATYYVAQQRSSTSARPCFHAVGTFGTGTVTGGTYGTLPSTITPPTEFTTAVGPISTLY